MNKKSLTGILSTVALTTGVVFVSVSPSIAVCPFSSQSKNVSVSDNGFSPTFSQKPIDKKSGITALGLAGVAGLVAASSVAYNNRKKQQKQAIIDELPVIEIEPVVTSTVSAKKELTLVN